MLFFYFVLKVEKLEGKKRFPEKNVLKNDHKYIFRAFSTYHESALVQDAYTGAGHIIRISSKSWFISLIPFKKWNLYNVYIQSTQTDIFQVFSYFNFDDYNWQLMKTPNSVSQKIRILWKGSILKTTGATL